MARKSPEATSSTPAAPPAATPAAAEQTTSTGPTPEVGAKDSSEVVTASEKPVGSRRWADIELDEDDDLEEESVALVGRAAKRQRQRLRRRLGRVEAAAERLADRSASGDGSQTSSSGAGGHSRKAAKHGSGEGSEATTALETKEMVVEASSSTLPKAAFTTTPEFERYRVAYRSFRLGNAAGAKGEVSHAASPDVSQKGPVQRLTLLSSLLKAFSLCVGHA